MTVGGRALGRARLALALAHLPAAVSLCNDTCTNVVVRPGEVEGGPDTVEVLESGEAHELPAGTEHTSYGAEAEAFDGEVVVGGPSTLSVPYSSIRVLAEISLEMRKAAQTFARWLNAERGGLQVRGARLAMKVVFVDDRGSRAQVTNATARALRARGGVHFALGPYSSGLTQYAARQADADGRLMISAGSSYTYVYEQNLTRLFGFVPPSWEIFGLRAILRAAAERDDAAAGAGAAAAAADLCGAAGCVSQLRFGMLGQGCDPGAMRDAEELFGAASHWERVTDEASRAELGLALRRLKDRAVTVLFICKLSLETLVEATRLMSEPELDYEVHALMGFGLVSSPRFLAELRMGWWQGAHWLEPIAWHGASGSEIRGNFSNLTSQEFHALFYDQWKLEPSYFAAAQFCALCALSEAIEQADSLESDLVASAMRNLSSLTEFYNPRGVRFDRNGQLDQDLMVLQAPRDRNGSVLVVGAPEGGARMVFPKPSWAQQKCVYESSSLTLSGQECSGRGSCLLDGRCQCSSGRGSYCEEQASSLHESSFESFWVENAQLILMLSAAFLIVGCAALAMGILVPFRRRRRRRAKKAARQLLDEALAHEHWEDVCKRCFSKGRSMIASSLSTSEIEEHMRLKSERWGISVAYLLSEEFTGLARRRSGEDDPTFYQLRDVFFLGADPIGERERCPRDGYDGCAFVDSRVLPAKHRGKCTHFLSWTWAYRLSVVQDALRSWIEELEHDGLAEEESAETVYLYMCFFVNNQYRILDQSKKRDKAKTGSDNLASVFEENLRSIGRVLALFDVWNGPTYLTRIWTIFEQAMAIKLSIEPQIIMPKAEIRTFMGQLAHGNEGISRVKTALFKVNTERAEASVQKDKENVQHMILDTFGSFTYVDSQIKKLMVRWLGRATESIFHDLMRQDSQRSLPVDPDGPSEGPQPGISILRARPRALFKSLSTRSMRYWGKVAAVGPHSPSGSPRALDPDPWQVPNASKLPGVPSREELHRDGDALPALLS